MHLHFFLVSYRTSSSYAGSAMAVRPACLQREVAEGAGDKIYERGNNATSRYVHKMKSCVHKLKCRRQHS